MVGNLLVSLFEHNHWANLQILQVCFVLSDEQLDAQPQTATRGTIRRTLEHLVNSQRGYLALLTLPLASRPTDRPSFADLPEMARTSGEGLVALVRDGGGELSQKQIETDDGYLVEPWVVLLQVINHATEHREQIKSMLTALGIEPPDIDGWSYGEHTHALTPISK